MTAVLEPMTLSVIWSQTAAAVTGVRRNKVRNAMQAPDCSRQRVDANNIRRTDGFPEPEVAGRTRGVHLWRRDLTLKRVEDQEGHGYLRPTPGSYLRGRR